MKRDAISLVALKVYPGTEVRSWRRNPCKHAGGAPPSAGQVPVARSYLLWLAARTQSIARHRLSQALTASLSSALATDSFGRVARSVFLVIVAEPGWRLWQWPLGSITMIHVLLISPGHGRKPLSRTTTVHAFITVVISRATPPSRRITTTA